MPTVAFHASHELLPPSELLEAAIAAESAGFQGVTASDHLAPWSERQGHSGHAWSWLGAAMQATSIPFGVVTAPDQASQLATALRLAYCQPRVEAFFNFLLVDEPSLGR